MGTYCACGCGLRVPDKGHYRSKCLPEGKKSPIRKSNNQRSKDKLEVRKAAAVTDVAIPALMKPHMDDATSKALFLFNKKLLQVRKLNEVKVIVISIDVAAEGLHPSGRNGGNSIVKEMEQASLWNNAEMANLVRLVPYKGVTYFKNPTVAEQKAFGTPGELLFNAEGNKQLALHVEKVMQANVIYRENFTNEKIKLLQLTAGNSPYKTGICFFVLNKIEEMRFIFKGNLSNTQLQHPKLPTGIEDLEDDDSDDDAEEEEHVGDVGDDENGDDGGDCEYELHGGGVSSCARSSSRIYQQTNFLADYGKT